MPWVTIRMVTQIFCMIYHFVSKQPEIFSTKKSDHIAVIGLLFISLR